MVPFLTLRDIITSKPTEGGRAENSQIQPLLPLLANGEPGRERKGIRESFTTIDDCIELAKELAARLSQLGEQKHPLAVRKGRMEVAKVLDQESSRTVKAGSKTYFFDIKQTREGTSYLVIAESRFKGTGRERERTSIAIFPEHARDFLDAVQQMVEALG